MWLQRDAEASDRRPWGAQRGLSVSVTTQGTTVTDSGDFHSWGCSVEQPCAFTNVGPSYTRLCHSGLNPQYCQEWGERERGEKKREKKKEKRLRAQGIQMTLSRPSLGTFFGH